MNLFAAVKKLCLEPGVLFPVANIFLFAQSDNWLALGIAIVSVLFSGWATLHKNPRMTPLRILAWMVLLSALCALWSGAVLAALAGFAFFIGNFLASNRRAMQLLHDKNFAQGLKILLHPATYYGIGYCMAGLMAGGGGDLLAHPFDHMQALVMVSIGMAVILVASVGLALNLMKSSMPFWILAGGTAINTLAGLFAGNYMGAASCLFSMFGEMRLGWMTAETAKQKDTGI